MITIEEALQLVDNAIKPERLNSVQELILTHCWSGKTYQEIAKISGYDSDYVRVVGSRLWQLLSESFSEKITKSNFRSILRQQIGRVEQQEPTQGYISALELPETPVPLNSVLYVQRLPIETLAFEEIVKPGALIRIKAPRHMGKTSLVMRILAQSQSKGYRTVRLNFLQAEDSVLGSLERLLRWFCANITLQLGMKSLLNDYWDEDLGFKVSATTYLQEYVLGQLESPLVTTIDEVNRLFDFPEVAQEFLPLLRFWHEESNNVPVWQKFRLIVTHSTEIYIPLSVHQSPFNVGLALKLNEFNWKQIQELARRFNLETTVPSLKLEHLKYLTQIIGGHPYLLSLAFCHLVTKDCDVDQLIAEATTDSGIYRDYLRGFLIMFRQHPELADAFKQVINHEQGVVLNSIVASELESMGLTKLKGNESSPLCKLYRIYFRDRL